MLAWAGRCWACLKYLHCFVLFFFFLVAESPGDEVTLRGDFRTRKSPRSSAGLLPYVYTRCSAARFALHILLSLETPGTKTKPCDPPSLSWSWRSQWFLTAGMLQLRSKYGFRGNSTSSLERKAKQPPPCLPCNYSLTWRVVFINLSSRSWCHCRVGVREVSESCGRGRARKCQQKEKE